MFTQLSTPTNVLAYQISGKITAEDVDRVYDDMRNAFELHDSVSFFAEMIDDFDMTGDAAWRDLTRAHEVIGHFKEIDRIAFVAKPSWIRAIAKVEQAIMSLFDFNMHVFEPSGRERALAWAKGEIDDPEEPSIRELPSDDKDIAIFEIDGKMRKADMEVAKAIMIQFLDEEKPRKLMADIKHLAGFELGILADRDLITLKLEAARHLDQYAIVGAPSWLQGYVETMDALLKPELRAFDADERAEALAWLKSD